mmetsp:Transcript_2428/g.3532  ORF Transcript_2428/g.3532 Transcript_2428/m.3532 type:complete len:85 (-) Transcript_2428:59-313(-)
MLNASTEKLTSIDKNTDSYSKLIRLGKKTLTGFLKTKANDSLKISLAMLVYMAVIVFTVWRRFPHATVMQLIDLTKQPLNSFTL